MGKKAKRVMEKARVRCAKIKSDAIEKEKIQREEEKEYSEKQVLNMKLDKIKSQIIAVKEDLKGAFKGNTVIENKLNVLKNQKEEIEKHGVN